MVKKNRKDPKISLVEELILDSAQNENQLSKKVGVSQPTISRLKKSSCDAGLIQAIVAIPNFHKIGYKLMAINFVKIKSLLDPDEVRKNNFEKVQTWMNDRPNVIFCSFSRGLGSDSFFMSVHKSYSDFDEFIQKHNDDLGHLLIKVKSILINLTESQIIKPFNFKYLAKHNFSNKLDKKT